MVPKNAANTNVLLWADKCWALFEAGQPHRLDPYTLETVGLDLLGGHLRAGVPFTLGSGRLDKLAGSHRCCVIMCHVALSKESEIYAALC